MSSMGHQAADPVAIPEDRPSIPLVKFRVETEPEYPRQNSPASPSFPSTPVSPTESEFPSVFSPVDSHQSQRTIASSISSNDVFFIRALERLSESQRDAEGVEDSPLHARSSRVPVTPSNSPDRFIPSRNLHHSPSLPFRLSKSPHSLSPTERIHRRRDSDIDVFAPRSRRYEARPRRVEAGDPRLTPHNLPRYVNHGLLSGHHSNPGDTAPTPRIRTQAMWTFQGRAIAPSGPQHAVSNGRGGFIGSGTVAPVYTANFVTRETAAQKTRAYESRVAFALGVDQAARVLDMSISQQPVENKIPAIIRSPVRWDTVGWGDTSSNSCSPKKSPKKASRPVPSTPFRVLDAPLLRDDFYCSTLAYCYTARVLAVGLGHKVYIWSEGTNVQYPPFRDYTSSNHVTSLSFSSQMGGHSILAVGRHGGQVTLWSTFDSEPRFEVRIPAAVASVCFKGRTTRRASSRLGSSFVDVEDLAIGDERGNIWYYSVEWTSAKWRLRHKWNGAMALLVKIEAHTQQICGIAWSPDGRYLATGGNDNVCLLFDTVDIIKKTEKYRETSLEKSDHSVAGSSLSTRLNLLQSYFQCGTNPGLSPVNNHDNLISSESSRSSRRMMESSPPKKVVTVKINSHKHRFLHAAAVKAIAFSPWEPTVLATGGGTNDRCIRFFHATSGTCLAIINVHAQVTSLIWSKTRREIAATFGYASPEHPYRIAVFAWPSCEQIVAIPWSITTGHERNGAPADCGRALWAISYPGGPNEMAHQLAEPASPTRRHPPFGPHRSDIGSEDSQSALSNKEGDTWWSRTAEEGCIIVASSDESVKFHEVWSGAPKSVAGVSGLLGGSTILESMEGIEKETEVIR